MLRVKLLNAKKKIENATNRDDSVLIIGKGNNSYKLRQIETYNSKEKVKELYNNSELCEAYSQAFDMGAKNIFLINVQNITDYIEIIDVIKQYNFAYIVPLNITLSDTFFHSKLKRQVSYAEYYLSSLGNYCDSLIIMTDNHASLYEDIDDFLNDMKRKIVKFKTVSEFALNKGRSICFVANNLKNYKYGNLVLASILATCSYDKYPEYDFGEAIFNIDYFDIRQLEMVYFKNNILKDTSVENLKNFRKENDADKLILIDKAVRYIERYLDLSEYNGKLYTEYVKLQIYSKLSDFLRNIKGVVIKDYKINSVDFIKKDNFSGIILNDFSVMPINSIEDFNIITEV